MKNFLKNTSLLSLVAIVAALTFTTASAQQAPEFMVTWKSNNYAPPNFQGKILPIANSQIEMALEIIDGGKLANLSGNEIRWLINDTELKSGVGLKNISFAAEGVKGDQEIEITVKKYKGQDLEKTIEIPLTRPEVVIVGGPDIFEALLYFFNITNLNQAEITWFANGDTVKGFVINPAIIDTSDVPARSEIALKAEASNLGRPLEVGEESIYIIK